MREIGDSARTGALIAKSLASEALVGVDSLSAA